MTKYSRLNFVYRMQKWMDSVMGQTFLNYAYSWGAAVVILGTLFKLTHLTGANIMLFIGMGTEVCVFFISAFDRPFDKTADGRDIATHANLDEIDGEGITPAKQPVYAAKHNTPTLNSTRETITPLHESTTTATSADRKTEQQVSQNEVKVQPIPSSQIIQNQESTPEMAEAQGNYVTELTKLTEMLSKVSEQSERLTRDSEEMENLNRTLTGISKVYEMQLKSASQQIGTIDQINEQSKLMAKQIEQLNKIYARMIEAMTVNMHIPAPGVTPKTDY